MSEQQMVAPPDSRSAGGLLREARQARGMHLAALAASLKVSPSRLEAIEQDRWHELPDLSYARAFAHTVSRALGIDPEPVLRALPQAEQPQLEKIDAGLDEPFREGPSAGWRTWPWRWVLAAGAVGAGLLGLAWWSGGFGQAATREALAPAASPAASATVPAGPSLAAASAPVSTAVAVTPTRLRVSASRASWVQILDEQGKPLLSRVIGEGEVVELPFTPPMSVTAGNAAATAVWLDDRPVDLVAATRDNVARLDLR